MQVFKHINDMQAWSQAQKKQGLTIGLVPTMGYLHAGHLSLVQAAREQCDRVIVSIFVNPTQFGAGEDFADYPRDIERDCELLQQAQADAVFAPDAREMYAQDFNTWVEVKGEITAKLCGASRPNHFKGVTTVVSKLFNICLPDRAFFGQKDVQQAMIIEKMARELNFPLSIVRVPIMREASGLAMSSRNVYLSSEQKEQALVLSQSLQKAAQLIAAGERDPAHIKGVIRDMIAQSPEAVIDYAEIYDAHGLSDVEVVQGSVLIALAVKFGTTRLIDNLIVEV